MATPKFATEVVDAYNGMATLESADDFFVAAFAQTDKALLALHAKGRGGMAALVEILERDFPAELAVGMFRVTALDERGMTVSRRTKLVHVIFIGPKTPVMVRAKVSSWNAALRQPFTFNLAIQTDAARDDLVEAAIEKALRASGGAHQPTSYDFSNSATQQDTLPNKRNVDTSSPAPSGNVSSKTATFVPIETAHVPPPSLPTPLGPVTPSRRTPGGSEKFHSIMDRYQAAFAAEEIDRLASLYEPNATLIHTGIASETTTQHQGHDAIREFYESKLGRLTPGYRLISIVKLQPDPEQTSEGVAYLHWTADAVAFASETILVVGGGIIAHTVVTDLEAESERGDAVAPLRSEWPGGSTTASFGDQSVGDGTTTLDDASTDGEHNPHSDEEQQDDAARASTMAQPSDTDSLAPTLISEQEHEDIAHASTMAQPSDTDSLAPTLVSEEDPTIQSQLTDSKKGSLEGEEDLNFGGDDDSVNLVGGTSQKSEETE